MVAAMDMVTTTVTRGMGRDMIMDMDMAAGVDMVMTMGA
jgi:hypothetical protein